MRISLWRKLSFLVASVALFGGLMAMPLGALASHPQTCLEAVAAGLLPPPDNDGHVRLCHFTGSGSNPFVINQPSVSAWETHQFHHGDCVRFFDNSLICNP